MVDHIRRSNNIPTTPTPKGIKREVLEGAELASLGKNTINDSMKRANRTIENTNTPISRTFDGHKRSVSKKAPGDAAKVQAIGNKIFKSSMQGLSSIRISGSHHHKHG